MELEFVGKPDVEIHSRLISERVRLRARSRTASKSVNGEARALMMEVDGLTVEAFVTVGPDGGHHLGLATFKTLNVLGDGRVGKDVNFAVQSENGQVLSVREQMVVKPVHLETNAEVIEFVKSEMARHAEALAKRGALARTARQGRPRQSRDRTVKGVDSVALFLCLFFQPELTLLCLLAAARASAAAAARNGDEEMVAA